MASPIPTAELYSDITDDFDIHPIKRDLIRFVNESAVKRSIRNLIYTSKTERFFRPTLGCGIKNYLFEPPSPITANDIRSEIEQTISNFEKRVRNLSVSVTLNSAEDGYNVRVLFYQVNVPTQQSLTVNLERIR